MKMDYQWLYHTMFNAATDALRHLERGEIADAMVLLAAAQCSCEEFYMENTTESA